MAMEIHRGIVEMPVTLPRSHHVGRIASKTRYVKIATGSVALGVREVFLIWPKDYGLHANTVNNQVAEPHVTPGTRIIKEFIGCFAYGNGHQLLLKSSAPGNHGLWAMDLEAQSLQPGVMAHYGRVDVPGNILDLEGWEFENLILDGFASVKENPLSYTKVALRRPGCELTKWYERTQCEAKYGIGFIRDRQIAHRVRLGITNEASSVRTPRRNPRPTPSRDTPARQQPARRRNDRLAGINVRACQQQGGG
ncbi:hypothetical protein BKA65DRAFT_592354 [Rhexocercosporidium sp. MPI-PUGE-AT-0058]|nr:hypothetical protein BKA65DRAFT_592354 [Rhexocercosporidium sp. MPI-PUGE-AT-0058]